MSSGQGQGDRSKKGRKCVLPHCKTSIGNNSGSVKRHRAMKFVYSMGFSDNRGGRYLVLLRSKV